MKFFNNHKIKKYEKFFRSKNEIYDYETSILIDKILKKNSNAIDIGAHKGKFLQEFLKVAPTGEHYAFEPLPYLYKKLIKEAPKNCHIFNVALSNKKGKTSFNYVRDYPGFSGLKQRKYPLQTTRIDKIKVKTDLLDNIIPKDTKIDFIKVDVEGAEYLVFQGGLKTIKKWNPVIVFEFGLGCADFFGVTGEKMFNLLSKKCNLHISTMERYFLKGKYFDKKTFVNYFKKSIDYYFVAYK